MERWVRRFTRRHGEDLVSQRKENSVFDFDRELPEVPEVGRQICEVEPVIDHVARGRQCQRFGGFDHRTSARLSNECHHVAGHKGVHVDSVWAERKSKLKNYVRIVRVDRGHDSVVQYQSAVK